MALCNEHHCPRPPARNKKKCRYHLAERLWKWREEQRKKLEEYRMAHPEIVYVGRARKTAQAAYAAKVKRTGKGQKR